jgi:uncharacterized protein YfaS (alpha-2-macroglobulin family)
VLWFTQLRAVSLLCAIPLCGILLPSALAQDNDGEAYFSISSQKTYLPGEKPEVAVYSHNVKQLEFRVYRVNDPVKFFTQLQDLHSFGGRGPALPKQPRTWLEKFHAWKHRLWAWIRDVVRAQFSVEARHQIRLWRMGEAEKPQKRGPQAENYAQVPLLNQQQVVSVWKWTVPAHERWESQTINVPVTDKGVYLVEATDGSLRAYTIAVVTELAVVTKAAPGRLLTYVIDRQSGDPIPGTQLQVWINQKEITSGQSDVQGLFETKISDEKPENVAVLATHGDQFAVNTPGAWNLGDAPDRNLRGYTYTDRPVYRPGDTVHFKTIVRAETPIGYQLTQDRELRLELRDPQTFEPIWNQTVKLNDIGTAHWEYQVPADAHLGFYYLSMQMGERYVEGSSFSVQDYKKPEYAVKVTAQTPRVLQGQAIKATIEARYYFGEPVANGKVTWVVHTTPYYPPGRYAAEDEDMGEGADSDEGQYAGEGGEQEQEHKGVLDADGKLQITVPTRANNKDKQDLVYRIEARVTDAGNREISGRGYAIATYGSFYLTAQPDAYVYSKGSTATITVIAQDYGKKAVATAFRAELSRWNWQKRSGEVISTAQGQTDAGGKGQVQFVIPDAGEFRVRVSANTPEHREVQDTAFLWAPGQSPWWTGAQQERVQIVADKKSYSPGDTGHVLIVTGNDPASVLVTVEGNGLYSSQVVKSSGGSITVEVPIRPEYAPNVYVAATFVRGNKLYEGNKSLSVPPTEHELKVDLRPSKSQYEPGEAASYTIKSTDAGGKPVSAEFSLGVVDEAIYAIQPETVQPILKAFYGTIYSKVSTDTSLSYYFSGEAGKRAMELARLRPHRSLAQLKPERLVQPKIRKAFPDTAFWVADVNTDSSGQATVKFNYPDAITSWRATTRGVTQDTRVGSAVENTIVRKNLMVRLVVPRFFRRGDEIVLSTFVQNYLPMEKTARVSMDFTGLQVLDGGVKDIPVPSRGLAKVDYRVRVLDVDSAKVLGKALTDVESDAMELTLPVVPFGVRLLGGGAGSIGAGNGDLTTSIAFPPGIEANTRKLTISLTPSIAGTIFGALDYLTSYPYGCTEQTMSSFLPDVLVADALKKLDVKSNIDPAVLNKQVQAGIERLYNYHHPDGGWGWWQTDDSQPFMTAYVLAGLAQAKAIEYDVRDDVIESGRKWLLGEFTKQQRVASDLRAYMAYALVLTGTDSNTAILDSVWAQRSTLTAYGQALLGLAMLKAGDARANELVKQLESSAKQNDAQAWWPVEENYLMNYYGDTAPQATAFAMKLLTEVDPQSPLLPKAALYLVNNRSDGYYWTSTQQTAAVLYGLTDYLQHTRELKPNFSVGVKVNGNTVGTKKFTGADAFSPATAITLNDAQLAPENNQVQLTKSGDGRLYWSTRSEYYSSQQKVVNSGTFQLSVVRQYYKLTSTQKNGRVVYHMDALNGQVQVGDTLAVRITVGGNEWRYLMIEDPIPSGTEPIARDDLYELDEKPSWWTRGWGYRELYDDKTTFFTAYFPRGQKEYTYLLKVVNPGEFRVSPTRVEPMYQPDYLATSDAMKVSVK